MANKCDVVVIGSCNVDLISYVERFPKAGETVCGSKFVMGCGGKGANQCVMAAKLGAKTAMIGCVGDDSFGDMYLENFKSLNVNTDNVHVIKGLSTGVAPITVNSQGENSIVIVKGANECLSVRQLNDALEVIQHAKVVLCQLEIALDVTLAALKMSQENNVATIFNPAPATKDLPVDFLKYSTILCCNETETEILTGITVSNIEEAKAAMKQLLLMGPETVVVTLGAKGAIFGHKDSADVQHVSPKDFGRTAVDTTGAGDSFVGSLAYFLSARNDLAFSEKIRRSVEIASLTVMKPGTQSSYPTYEELPADLCQ